MAMEMDVLSLVCEIIYGEMNICLQTAIMPHSVYTHLELAKRCHCHYSHPTSSLNNYVD